MLAPLKSPLVIFLKIWRWWREKKKGEERSSGQVEDGGWMLGWGQNGLLPTSGWLEAHSSAQGGKFLFGGEFWFAVISLSAPNHPMRSLRAWAWGIIIGSVRVFAGRANYAGLAEGTFTIHTKDASLSCLFLLDTGFLHDHVADFSDKLLKSA